MEWTTIALLLPSFLWHGNVLDRPLLNDYWPTTPTYFRGSFLTGSRLAQNDSPVSSPKSPSEEEGLLSWHFETWDSKWRLSGEQELRFGYGTSRALRRQDPNARDEGRLDYQYWLRNLFDEDKPPIPQNPFARGDLVGDGPSFEHKIKVSLKGSVGEKVEVELNHNPKEEKKSAYTIEYTGGPEELLQNIAVGQIDLNFHSGLSLVPDPLLNQKGLGLQLRRTSGPLKVEAVGSMPTTLSESKTFTFDQREEVVLRDIDYVQGTYFELPSGLLRSGQNLRYYEEITDSNRFNEAALVCRDVLLSGKRRLHKYFRKVPASLYVVQSTSGLFRLKKSPPSGYSLLLVEGGSQGNPSEEGNAEAFFGSNYRLEFAFPNPSAPGNRRLLVLHVPKSDLRDKDMTNHYESRRHYPIPKGMQLGDFAVRIEDRNGVLADNKIWQGGLQHAFEHYGTALLNPQQGVLYFERTEVFGAVPRHYGGMYEVAVPDSKRHHRLQIRMQVASDPKGPIDLGRFGVVASSVVITKNGRPLDKSTYSVGASGLVHFNERAGLHKGSQIEVHYDYEPFEGGTGKTWLALRMDLLSPFPNNSISLVAMSALDSGSAEGTRIGEEPTGHFVGGAKLNLDLVSLLTRSQRNAHRIGVESEVAFSVFNPNRNGEALVHSPESPLGTFRLGLDSEGYYFTANPQWEALPNTHLGRSYYTDFSAYSASGDRRPVAFRWRNEVEMRHNTNDSLFTARQDINFRPFSEKPGPYHVVGESHLNPTLHPEHKALVLDYDFGGQSSVGYVSFVTSLGLLGAAQERWGEHTTLEVVYKILPASDSKGNLLPSPGSVGFTIDVGNLNEDFDLDNRLDEEDSLFDVDGFEFNYSQGGTRLRTQLGGGRRPSSKSQSGNQKKDTEDLNRNGQLESLGAQEEEVYTYPRSWGGQNATNLFVLMSRGRLQQRARRLGGQTYEWNGVSYEVLEVPEVGADSSDQKDPYVQENYIRMKVAIPLPSDADLGVLERVFHLRLNLIDLPESLAPRGRVVVEALSFKRNPWDAIHVDGVRLSHAKQFVFETLEGFDDGDYASNPFAKAHLKTYESLHGPLLNRELETLKEHAYQVGYRLNGERLLAEGAGPDTQGRFAWAESHLFSSEEAVDLSKYKTLNVALYLHRYSDSGDEEFVYRFGEDEDNHFELRIPMRFIQSANDRSSSKSWTILVIRVQVDGGAQFTLAKKTMEVLPLGNRGDSEAEALPPHQYRFSTTGRPRLNRIQYVAVGVDSLGRDVEGRFWVQNFYASEPRLQVGHATKNTFTYQQEVPLSVGNREWLSGFKVQMGHEYRGLGFRTFEDEGNGTQEESVQFLWGATLWRLWDLRFEQSQEYEMSEHKESLLPKEDQSLLVRDRRSFLTRLDFGSHPVLPTLSHSFETHAVREVDFETQDDLEGSRNYASVMSESIVETTTLSESKPFLFLPNLGFEQEYRLEVSFHKEALFERPVRLGASRLYEPKGFFAVYPSTFVTTNTWEERFPIWNDFPDPGLPMSERIQEAERNDAVITTLQYKVEHEQAIHLKLFLYQLELAVGFEAGNSHRLALWDAEQGEAIAVEGEPFEVWDRPYWNRWEALLGVVEHSPDHEPVERRHAYSLAFSHASPDVEGDPKSNGFLSGVRGEVNIQQSQKHFREVLSPFGTEEFLHYESDRLLKASWVGEQDPRSPSLGEQLSRLGHYAEEVGEFYDSPRPYKTIENAMQWRLELPVWGWLRLGFARQLAHTEENVLNLIHSDLSDQERQLWQSIEGDFQALNLDLKGDGVSGDSWMELGGLLGLPPYVDFWFLQDALYWVLRPWVNPHRRDRTKTIFMNSYRFWVAREVDLRLREVSRAEGALQSAHIASFNAHQDHASDLNVEDSFSLDIKLQPKSLWAFVVPEQLNYNGSLETGKTNWVVRQSQHRSVSFSKDLNKWLGLAALPFQRKPNERLQSQFSLSYAEQQHYATKVLNEQYRHSFRVELGPPKGFRVAGTYSFERSKSLYPLRYRFADVDGNDHYAPYMGIGPYYEVVVSNAFLGTEETLNLGEFEDIHQTRSTEDLGGDLLDLEQRTHEFGLQLSLKERRQFDFLNAFSIFPIVKSRLDLSLSLMGYEVPYVDEAPIRDGAQLEAGQQPNGVAAKNIALLFDPVPIGSFIEDWVVTVQWTDLVEFGNTFRIESTFTVAFLSQFIARSYQAYLKVQSEQALPEAYLREGDTIQVGLDFSLAMKLLF